MLIKIKTSLKKNKTVTKYNYTPKSGTLTLPNAAEDVGATGILFHCWWQCKMI